MKMQVIPFALITVCSICIQSLSQNVYPSSGTVVVDAVDNWTSGIKLQNTGSFQHLITGYADGVNPTFGSGLQFKVANNNTGGNTPVMTLRGNGNVGIGTASPGARISFPDMNSSINAEGITWYNQTPSSYGIFKEAGSWTGPNYQQLKVNWQTGIVLDPGTEYGRSYVDVMGGGLRVSRGGASPINTTGLFQLNYSSNAAFTGALIKNSGTGNISYAELSLFNNIDKLGQIFFTGSNYSANPNAAPNTMGLYSGGSGGLSFITDDAQAPIRFATLNATRMTISPAGNTGIGTISPLAKLHINSIGNGIDPENYTAAEHSLFLQNSSTVNGNINAISFGDAGGWGVANCGVVTNPNNHSGKLYFSTRPSASIAAPLVRMLIDENGNVGIGTKSPDQRLTVNGKIHATEVIVTATVPAPDYVFDSLYPLSPLDSVQSYIAVNHHLPDVPSAADMEKDGINVSEMNMLLLKKIEELTLYLIDVKHENEIQLKKMQQEIEILKKQGK
ncbi:hypothetical protein BH09BAC3_BH09BAC3_35270 [soil metagenome]